MYLTTDTYLAYPGSMSIKSSFIFFTAYHGKYQILGMLLISFSRIQNISMIYNDKKMASLNRFEFFLFTQGALGFVLLGIL